MGSAVSNGTTSVGTKTHEANMNLATWTWAGWVKRTGVGEGDFRLVNKASGSNAGPLQVTGQSGGGALRGRQIRATTASVAISLGDVMPSDTWVCLFVIFNGADAQGIRLYAYNGTSAVAEMSYSSITNGSGAATFNTEALRVFNTTDGSLTYQGKAAHWVITPDIWNNATMLGFAQGTLPTGLYDHYYPFQTDGSDAGEVGGWTLTLSNVTFDGADSPPVTYGGSGATATPAVIAATVALPQATPQTGTNATVAPATVAATTALTRPAGNVQARPATIAAAATLPAWAVDVAASPDEIAATAALPAATASSAASATAQPATITASAALPSASRSGNATASPATVTATAALATAAVSTNVTVQPAVLAATTAVPAVTIQASGNVTVSAATIAAVVSLPTATIQASGNATASPATITATVGLSAVIVVTPGSEVAIHTGPADGPARYLETITGPELARDVTGPLPSRAMTGPELVTVAVAGPARTAGAEPTGPDVSRDVTGPDTARTLTGPGA